jgi:glycosyltransferase involved in cell wall biosynthesis
MDVALVASVVAPIRAAAANGPHSVIRDLARGLLARGHRVTVYAAAGSELPGVPLVEVPMPDGVSAGRIRVGHLSEAPPEAVRIGFERLAAELRRRSPEVVEQHAFDAEAIELFEGLPVLHLLHLPPVVPRVVAAVRGSRATIATVSNAAAAQWRAAVGREPRVLPNGVPDPGLAIAPVEPQAVIAGRISPEKGTAVAIAAARAAGLRPLVVGDAYDADYFSRRVAPLLEAGSFLGPLPRAELSRLLNRSAALLMASEWEETFGLVAAEAQMVGCPVVAYRRGALDEVVRDGVSGWLVEPGDAAGLVAALRRLGGLDRALIRRAAKARFSVDRMVEAHLGALARVVRGAGVADPLAVRLPDATRQGATRAAHHRRRALGPVRGRDGDRPAAGA